MSTLGYPHAVAALQFFSFPGPAQGESWRTRHQDFPRLFFPEQSEADRGCDYFFGVACVFKTYRNSLYDRFLSMEEAEEKAGHLGDFNHRLNFFMQDGTAAEWSAAGVLEGECWERLRVDAQKALNELGESLPNEPPVFDIEALISPAEFRTSDEARRLLG
jgi:hypothetical protein